MTRLAALVPVLLAVAVVGCGSGADQWKEAAENVRRGEEALEKRLKGIADDTALADQDAIQQYLDVLPTAGTGKNLPKDVAPEWSAKKTNGEWHVIIHGML